MAESSLNWDDLSDAPPPLPAVPAGSADPDADAIIAKMNAGVAAGKSEDEILSTEVADFGRKGRKASATSDKTLSWDDLFDSPPRPELSDISAQQNVYNAPNYQQVPLSPVARDTGSVGDSDVPVTPLPIQGEARAADAAQAVPADNRREVGAGEALWRQANQAAAGTESLLSGAASAIGYPITAADAAISGRPVPSLSEAVAAGQAPSQAAAQSYALDPNKERVGLAGEIGGAVGQGGTDILTMLGMGPARVAEAGAGLAEQLATKLYQVAKVSSLPAARNAKDAAQQAINAGATPEDAAKAAASAYDSTVVGNMLPISARGGLPVRAATGAGIGAGQAALAGGDEQQIISGAATGGLNAAVFGEGATPETPASIKARAQHLADQTAIKEGVDIAQGASDATGVTDTINKAIAANNETAEAITEEPANAPETRQEERQPEHPGNAQSGLPAEASGGGSDANGVSQEAAPVSAAQQHAASRLSDLSKTGRALTDAERDEQEFLQGNPTPEQIAAVYNLPKEVANVDTNAGPGAASGEAEPTQETPARRPSEVRAARLQELRQTGEAQGLTPDQVKEYGALVNADRTQGRIAHTGEPIEGLLNEAGRQERLASGEIPANRAFIDLVGFHDFNEKHGYANGNAVLRSFGRELANHLPENHGSVVGGDEFYAHGTPEQLAAAEQGLRQSMADKSVAIKDENGNVVGHVPAPDFRIGQGENDAAAQAAAKQSKPSGRSKAAGDTSASVGEAPARGEEAALGRTGTQLSTGEATKGVNAFVARKALEKAFGARALAKMEAAGLKLTSAAELPSIAPDLPASQHGGVKGVTTGKGRPHVIHDQTPAGELAGVAVHEVWHANQERVLSPGQQAGLARRVDALAKHSPKVRAAVEKIPVNERTDGEKVAYALEHLQDQSLGRRALDSIKLGLNRLGVPLEWMNAHEAALREIGQLNLRHFAESGGVSHLEGGAAQYHRVYHGSPHDFDKFDSSKIGTGEGAQAYGHGLYFAGSEAVARHYKEYLSSNNGEYKPGFFSNGKELNANPELSAVGSYLSDGTSKGLSVNEAKAIAKRMHPELSEKIDQIPSDLEVRNKAGKMYHVELAPKEHEYLDWDKPLSEQSPEVQAKLAKAYADRGMPLDENGVPKFFASNPDGQKLYASLSGIKGQEAGSKALHEAGIPGIRYLDGSSRNAGEGHHNYVIFNDKDATIVNKYSRTEQPEPVHVPGTFNAAKARAIMGKPGAPPQPGERTQGVKNAYKAQEQTERGYTPVEAEGKRDFGTVWDAATKKRQDDPGAGARLAADVAADPRPLRPEETALLIQHGAELNNRYDRVLGDIEAARQSGDRGAEMDAQLRRRELEDLLSIHDVAARQSGYEQGLGLAMRRAMAKQDFSLARQLARFKAIETDGKIPEMVRQRVEGHVKRIAELQKQLDDALAAREPAKRGASKPRKALDDDFSEMAARLKAIAGAPKAQQFARVADPEMATLIRKMARNRSDAGETDPAAILDAIHEAIGKAVPRQDIADTITTNAPARQHTKSELQSRYDALRKSLRDPEVQKNATRQKAITKELAEIKSRIQRGDFEKAKRVAPVYNEATRELQAQLNSARRKLDQLARQRERMQSGLVARTADLIHNIHMGAILSSIRVYPKLAAAVAARWVGTPLEEAIGSVMRHVPGISKVAALAPRHGAGFTPGAEAEAIRGIGRGLKGAGEQLRYGESKLDQLYGDKPHLTGEFTDFMGQLADAQGWMEKARVISGIPGRTHAAVKELASQPEFYRSYRLRENHMRDQLAGQGKSAAEIDEFLGRESTQAALGAKAFEDALEAKMQGKNWFADGVNTIVNHWERNGGVGGKALAFLFKTIFPIRKVPINIVKELTSYSVGGIKAAVASLHGELTPERADYIMKNIKKQGAGATLFALGYLGSSMFGGIPGTEKKKNPEIKPDEASFGGVGLGTYAFHGPAAQMLQLGAGFRKLFEKEYGSSHDAITAGLHAIGSNYGNLLVRSIPYFDQPRRMYNTYEWGRNSTFTNRGHGAGEVIGGQLRSMLVPQLVQQIASGNVGIDAVDNYLREKGIADPIEKPFARHPKNIVEDIELGIPGLRENVSTRKPH